MSIATSATSRVHHLIAQQLIASVAFVVQVDVFEDMYWLLLQQLGVEALHVHRPPV